MKINLKQTNNLQRYALLIIAIYYVTSISLTILKLWNQTSNTLLSLLFPITLYILSKAAASTPTKKVLNVAAIIFTITAFSPLAINILNSTYLYLSIIPALTYLAKTITELYIFGVIERSNNLNKTTKYTILSYILIKYIISIPANAIIALSPTLILYYSIIESFISFILFSLIICSSIFNGEKQDAPAPKGTYGFWNKYMTLFILTFAILTCYFVIINL